MEDDLNYSAVDVDDAEMSMEESDSGSEEGDEEIDLSGEDDTLAIDKGKKEINTDPSKMSKESLNILIISLRPCIAQAKVHIIHQLARQVASLKKKKCANDQEKAKNERKVGRFVEEISILKRAKKDIISRWLLVNKKTFAEVTKKETLTQKFNMKVRVFCRTAEHKAVKKVLDEFRQKFSLWEKEVPKLLGKLGKKRKKTDPNMQELGIKPVKSAEQTVEKEQASSKSDTVKKLIVGKREENKKDDNDSVGECENENERTTGNTDESDTDSGSDNDDGIVQQKDVAVTEYSESDAEENIFDEDHEFDKDDPANYSESDVEERSNSEGSGNETDSGDEEVFVNSLKNALKMSEGKDAVNLEVTPPLQKAAKIDKKKGEMLVRVLDLKKTVEEGKEDSSDNESNDIVETENNKKKLSSFFVGGESESEEENDVDVDEEPLPYGEDVLQMRQQSLKNKFQHEGAIGSGLNGHSGSVRGGKGRGERGNGVSNGNQNNNRGRGRGDFDKGRGRGGFQQRGRGSSDFHQRGRGDFRQRGRGRGDFQSTGTGRGSRGNTFAESRSGDAYRQPVGTNKVAEADSNLHPSWAAKKRTNTTIAKFEGKKIKFGDDGDSVKSVKPSYNKPTTKPSSAVGPPEKIHPSWAAKQSQKSSIQAFQGKKVVFGD